MVKAGHSLCTTDKGTLDEGEERIKRNQSRHNNSSVHSNFMSERTMNLKKEICNLDEEILMLQNSLKHALIKKSSDLNYSD
jgi:hypothetical protein